MSILPMGVREIQGKYMEFKENLPQNCAPAMPVLYSWQPRNVRADDCALPFDGGEWRMSLSQIGPAIGHFAQSPSAQNYFEEFKIWQNEQFHALFKCFAGIDCRKLSHSR